MWLSGFALVLFFFFLPETSSANILYRRTRRLRKITGKRQAYLRARITRRTVDWQGYRHDGSDPPDYSQLYRAHGVLAQSIHCPGE